MGIRIKMVAGDNYSVMAPGGVVTFGKIGVVRELPDALAEKLLEEDLPRWNKENQRTDAIKRFERTEEPETSVAKARAAEKNARARGADKQPDAKEPAAT